MCIRAVVRVCRYNLVQLCACALVHAQLHTLAQKSKPNRLVCALVLLCMHHCIPLFIRALVPLCLHNCTHLCMRILVQSCSCAFVRLYVRAFVLALSCAVVQLCTCAVAHARNYAVMQLRSCTFVQMYACAEDTHGVHCLFSKT